MITKDILIEELVEKYPFSVNYLAKNGIRCIVCGESIWGTLEEAVKDKGFDSQTLEQFVKELNELNEKFEKETEEEFRKIDTKKADV